MGASAARLARISQYSFMVPLRAMAMFSISKMMSAGRMPTRSAGEPDSTEATQMPEKEPSSRAMASPLMPSQR